MQLPITIASFQSALQQCGWQPGQPVLLAISGGVDSVVLAHLLKNATVPFAFAHVNYKLRGEESERDSDFVAELAEKLNVPFFLKQANQDELRGNIQAAARSLRYSFFETIAQRESFSWIATGHHLNDTIETVLLNLTRGTGIDGLVGIAQTNGKLIRPLLGYTREAILDYAKANQLVWREDSSNAADKYTRNRLRNQLIPELIEQVPQGTEGFRHSLRLLQDAQVLQEEIITHYRNALTNSSPRGLEIHFKPLLEHPAALSLLYAFIEPFDFNTSEATQVLKLSQTGTYVENNNYRITLDRELLVVATRENHQSRQWQIEIDTQLPFLTIESIAKPETHQTDAWTAMMDLNTISWPLELRTWQQGDEMHPFGMKGRKKISDVLTEIQWSSSTRKKALVLLSAGKIIWLPGYRIGEQVRITHNTSSVLLLRFDKNADIIA